MSDDKGGLLRYKCRMCGEEYQNTHVPDIRKAVSAIVHGFPNPWPQGISLPGMTAPHYHKNSVRLQLWRYKEAIALLRSLRNVSEEEAQEQRKTWELLEQALDEDKYH